MVRWSELQNNNVLGRQSRRLILAPRYQAGEGGAGPSCETLANEEGRCCIRIDWTVTRNAYLKTSKHQVYHRH